MTYEEKVRWLRRYRDSLRLERTLREELAEQQSRACKITAALTGMPGGGRGRPGAAAHRGEYYRRAAGIAGADQPLRGCPAGGCRRP